LPHTDRQEFYNDFNDYSFSIKAPKKLCGLRYRRFTKSDAVLQAEFSNRLKNPIPLMPLFMLQMSKK
jgi:hypothetical protein